MLGTRMTQLLYFGCNKEFSLKIENHHFKTLTIF